MGKLDLKFLFQQVFDSILVPLFSTTELTKLHQYNFKRLWRKPLAVTKDHRSAESETLPKSCESLVWTSCNFKIYLHKKAEIVESTDKPLCSGNFNGINFPKHQYQRYSLIRARKWTLNLYSYPILGSHYKKTSATMISETITLEFVEPTPKISVPQGKFSCVNYTKESESSGVSRRENFDFR